MAEGLDNKKVMTAVDWMIKASKISISNEAMVKKAAHDAKALADKQAAAADAIVTSTGEQKKINAFRINSFGQTKMLFGLMNRGAKNYFEKTELNQITWGGLAKSIAKGAKDWYERTLKSNTLLGKALRFNHAVMQGWKAASAQMSKVFSAIGGQVREALGPVAAAFDVVKDALMSGFHFMKGVLGAFIKKTPPADKRRNKLLQSLVDEMIRSRKGAALGKGGKKKMPGMGSIMLAMIGVVIGGLIGVILAPFRLLAVVLRKATKLGKWIRSSLATLGKAFPKIAGWFGKIAKWLKVAGGITKTLPIIGKIMIGVARGFKVLGWPLTILFGVIDFFTGFMAKWGAGGSLVESIGAGLKNAFMKFFEWPVKIIGWIIDKVLGWFGIEGADSANKILGFLSDAFDFIWSWIKLIIDGWTLIFKLIWDVVGPIVKAVGSKLAPIAKLIWEGIKWWVSTLWGKVKKVLKFFGWKGGAGESEGGTPSANKSPTDIAKEEEAQRKAKLEKIREEQRALLKAEKERKDLAEKQLQATKESGGASLAAAAGGQGGSGGGETLPQIPDEVDNWGMTSKNYDMEAMS